jgi:hypothetical protein
VVNAKCKLLEIVIRPYPGIAVLLVSLSAVLLKRVQENFFMASSVKLN